MPMGHSQAANFPGRDRLGMCVLDASEFGNEFSLTAPLLIL
jgi:hypothetical protein